MTSKRSPDESASTSPAAGLYGEPARLELEIVPQPNDVTCGPTCLHAIYRFHGDELPLEQVVQETRMLEGGGTLDVFLANHALKRGYAATIYTYNLQVFDPTWFGRDNAFIAERLRAQSEAKRSRRLAAATRGYLRFLELGGRLLFEDLTPDLIRRFLRRGIPILTGLSATYLYQDMREIEETSADDDARGEPTGHFVVLAGYDPDTREVLVADPYRANPISGSTRYSVHIRRLIGAIFLGVVTYDANMLVLEPPHRGRSHGGTDRRRRD